MLGQGLLPYSCRFRWVDEQVTINKENVNERLAAMGAATAQVRGHGCLSDGILKALNSGGPMDGCTRGVRRPCRHRHRHHRLESARCRKERARSGTVHAGPETVREAPKA